MRHLFFPTAAILLIAATPAFSETARTRPSADAAASGDMAAHIGASISATPSSIDNGVEVGMEVKTSAGGAGIGRIVDIAQVAAGHTQGAVVQTNEGGLRIVPAVDLDVQGGAAVTRLSVTEIMTLPRGR